VFALYTAGSGFTVIAVEVGDPCAPGIVGTRIHVHLVAQPDEERRAVRRASPGTVAEVEHADPLAVSDARDVTGGFRFGAVGREAAAEEEAEAHIRIRGSRRDQGLLAGGEAGARDTNPERRTALESADLDAASVVPHVPDVVHAVRRDRHSIHDGAERAILRRPLIQRVPDHDLVRVGEAELHELSLGRCGPGDPGEGRSVRREELAEVGGDEFGKSANLARIAFVCRASSRLLQGGTTADGERQQKSRNPACSSGMA
jgi:hypothetical protein